MTFSPLHFVGEQKWTWRTTTTFNVGQSGIQVAFREIVRSKIDNGARESASSVVESCCAGEYQVTA
jgi:hypothetical protein